MTRIVRSVNRGLSRNGRLPGSEPSTGVGTYCVSDLGHDEMPVSNSALAAPAMADVKMLGLPLWVCK
jgi:hypothetical protein